MVFWTGYYLYFKDEKLHLRSVNFLTACSKDKTWIQIFWLSISHEYFGNKWEQLKSASVQ